MQTHEDSQHLTAVGKRFMDSLQSKAEQIVAEKKSRITAGDDGEQVIMEYEAKNKVHVRRLPNDEHNILRISIGGGDDIPVEANYCVIRGEPKKCIGLLRKALNALLEGYCG